MTDEEESYRMTMDEARQNPDVIMFSPSLRTLQSEHEAILEMVKAAEIGGEVMWQEDGRAYRESTTYNGGIFEHPSLGLLRWELMPELDGSLMCNTWILGVKRVGEIWIPYDEQHQTIGTA